MLEIESPVEQPTFQPKVVDLREPIRTHELMPHIQIAGNQLAAQLWLEMLGRTQKTGLEYGVIVSSHRGKLLTSGIFEGMGESPNYDSEKKSTHPPRIFTPAFPHGIQSLSPWIHELAYVHSHPMPASLDRFPTSIISGGDAQTFLNLTFRAFAAIDRGGAHMLIKENVARDYRDFDPEKIEESVFKTAGGNSKLLAEARREMAKALMQYGTHYYFSEALTPDENGFIQFTDASRI